MNSAQRSQVKAWITDNWLDRRSRSGDLLVWNMEPHVVAALIHDDLRIHVPERTLVILVGEHYERWWLEQHQAITGIDPAELAREVYGGRRKKPTARSRRRRRRISAA